LASRSLVEVEVEAPIGFAVLNRPEKLNAMSTALLEELLKRLDELSDTAEVKVVAITGRGRFFSAGIDLAEAAEARTPDEAARPFIALARVFRRLLDYEKPVILGLNGDAYGGGAEMIWVADMVAAVRTAKLVWSEARWSLIAPALASLGPLVLGLHRAMYLALTSTPLSAEEAYQLGLVSSLVDTAEELRAAIKTLAERILENSPQAVKSFRKLVRLYVRPAIEHGISELERLARTSTFIEAARAFKAKQRPRYTW
jgi:enoyl-CoA hydratase/carnithine racemase